MKSKSLLIIGGTGFIGKSILDYLKKNNHLGINKIIIFSRGLKNIKNHNLKKKKIKIVKISGNILKIKKLPVTDYVIYCAILKNYNQDLEAVKNYLSLAIKCHLNSKILYISSGAVYGIQKPEIKGFKENYLENFKKINYKKGYKKKYSSIKLKNENLFKKFGEKGLQVSIARCFTFVGKNLPLDTHYVAGNIINNILQNKNLNIKANNKVTRSFMYSDDLARWLLKILDNSNIHCPVYNVGSDDAVDIHETALLLAKKYNLSIKSSAINSRATDTYIPIIYKAKKQLGLKNKLNSFQAIIKTVDLLKKNYETS